MQESSIMNAIKILIIGCLVFLGAGIANAASVDTSTVTARLVNLSGCTLDTRFTVTGEIRDDPWSDSFVYEVRDASGKYLLDGMYSTAYPTISVVRIGSTVPIWVETHIPGTSQLPITFRVYEYSGQRYQPLGPLGVVLYEQVLYEDDFRAGSSACNALVPVTNTAPIANAGDNITDALPNQIYELNGSQSADPEGDTLLYMWAQIGGIPVIISDPAAVSPTFAMPPGRINEPLVFQLVVFDGEYYSDPARVEVEYRGISRRKD